MIEYVVQNHCPATWPSKYFGTCLKVEVSPTSSEYRVLESAVSGAFNLGVKLIQRVDNPYLYGQFLLKKEEYETRGCCSVIQLYHDTGAHNVDSIIETNLDWRRANRVKYGQGVSFSPLPQYANRESSRSNGTSRAMIVADVLVGNAQHVSTSEQLPQQGYDTTVGNNGQVYVKYYDDEFYPKYVIYYESKPPAPYYRRRRFRF